MIANTPTTNRIALAMIRASRQDMRQYALMYRAVDKTLRTTPGLDDGQRVALAALRRKNLAIAISHRADAAFYQREGVRHLAHAAPV